MDNKIQTLHSHSSLSDGKLPLEDMLRTAGEAGIGVVAITEHDVLPNEELIQKLKTTDYGTDWVMGIEISAAVPEELQPSTNDEHILGLFIDPHNQELLDYCKTADEKRKWRMQEIVRNLQKHGFDITEEECLAIANGAPIAKPHLVQALLAKESNQKLMNEFLEKMKKDAETDPEVQKKYNRILEFGERQIPHVLFLSDDAYVSDIPVSQWRMAFTDAVKAIRNAGGIAVIAHYTFAKRDAGWSMELVEKLLSEDRLDGVETVYGLRELSMDEKLQAEIADDKQQLRELVKKYNKIATGGADAHTAEDFTTFASDSNYNAETKGMTEAIFATGKVTKEWTSLK